MRIGTEGDLSRRLDLEAWAAQMAAMHLTVARMTPGAPTGGDDREQAGAPAVQASVGPAETLRAQVFSSRQGPMSAQDGLGYLQVAGSDLERSQDALRRLRVVAAQAAADGFDAPQREALQRYVDRSVQDLEGTAEQARYHALKMLGGTASAWALPEGAPVVASAVAPVVAGLAPAAYEGGGRFGRPDQAGVPTPTTPSGGVAPVISVGPTAVPATNRPQEGFPGGDERRSPGGLPAGIDRSSGRAFDANAAAVSTALAGAAPVPRRLAFSGQASVGTAAEAAQLVTRVDSAADLLAKIGAVVDAAQESMLRAIGQLGLDQVRLPGGPAGSAPEGPAQAGVVPAVQAQGAALRQLTIQAEARSSAAVLVEATRAQFDAVTTVLGGAAAAAAVGSQAAPGFRDATVAARPAVEPVSAGTRSSRAESGRERHDRGSGGGSGVARR